MNKHTDGDPLPELAALRQRLSNLEAEHRELKRQATRTRRPAFSRKFLLSALPVALLLAVGLLYGQGAIDALFIDGNGKVGIGTNNPERVLDIKSRGTKTPFAIDNALFLSLNDGTVRVTNNAYVDEKGAWQIKNPEKKAFTLEIRDSGKLQLYGTPHTDGKTDWKELATFDAADNASAFRVNGVLEGIGAVPTGAILMWSGKVDQLPKGWVLCDGNNNTPNLKGRFIVGYDPGDSDYNRLGAIGGEKAHVLTGDEMPSHTHTGRTDAAGFELHNTSGLGGTNGLSAAHDQGTANFQHQHSFTTSPTGGGKPHENRPPYYVLAYIMYTGKTT